MRGVNYTIGVVVTQEIVMIDTGQASPTKV